MTNNQIMICPNWKECRRRIKYPFDCCEVPHKKNIGCSWGMDNACPNCIPLNIDKTFSDVVINKLSAIIAYRKQPEDFMEEIERLITYINMLVESEVSND